jgi:acetylornithine/N-succinyldiaminopimelate aminotransferase
MKVLEQRLFIDKNMDSKKIIKIEKKHVMQTYSRPEIVLDRGEGYYIFDHEGKRYLDMIGGIATCPLGHNYEGFAEAVYNQIAKITNPSNLFYSEPQVVLAEKLANLSGLDKCFFSNSGTEAAEAAIKLSRKYTGKPGIISTKHAFHGRSFGGLSATWKEKIRAPFKPLLSDFIHVDYGDAQAVKESINKKTGAVIVEPIQGEAGIISPKKGYLKELRDICDDKGILMIVDEVQTGCGRTGKFFAYEHDKIRPDIVMLAKGLANGIPIGVTISSDEVASSFKPGDHGSTFGGNPISCTAANFTINTILEHNLLVNAKVQGENILKSLKKIGSSFRDIRGKGLMIGISVDFDAKKTVNKCIANGLLINSPDKGLLRMLPPLIIDKKAIEESTKILGGVLG